MGRYIFILFFVFYCSNSFAQLDNVQELKVVNLHSIKLKKHSKGFKIVTLSDSVIVKNTESFSTLLRFNSPIYIKEYGAGGTSSASFRGTSASNTAVVWNGININSVNNGQTGFNSLTISLFDNVNIRSGGGSIEFGSGAIGGTIHLNNQLRFGNYIENQVVSSIGSYETFQNLYKFSFGSEKTAIKFGISYNQSKNDYKWLGYDVENENGAYKNINISFNLAQKLSEFSKISFYTEKFSGDRQFSGQLPNPSAAKEKYKDFSFRNLIDFHYAKENYAHSLKVAYLTQEYQYFADKNSEHFSFGKSQRFITKYNFNYKFSSNSNIETFSEYESTIGRTDEISNRKRQQWSQSVIFNQKIENIVAINAKVRKDFNSVYKMPFIFALGAEIKPLRNTFIRINGSKNYRVPSYNDLFWPALGNENLIPESAYQGEIGLGYKNNQFKIDVGAFYIDSKDKIVWRPGGDPERPGVWIPINLSSVVNKGLEIVLSYHENIENHFFTFNANYSYTIAENKKTNVFLPFVPKHMFNANIGYSYKRLGAYYQHLFNGKVFTTEDNIDMFTVPYFNVGNVGVDYILIKTEKKQLALGVKINNVFNEPYKVLPSRPMPNRNIKININYKF
ncbi:MAG: TonB-dependent receptor [Lutibacter sp.]|nr:TonB-dependent receptor [Lutibacter sp.]